MTQIPARRASALVMTLTALTLLASACGWGYASETYRAKKTTEPAGKVTYVKPEPRVDTTVVKKDPCEVDTFMVFRYDEQFRQAKELKCQTGKVLSLTRNDMTNAEYREMQLQNLPVGEWYVMVDPNNPNPTDRKVISNENLLGISKVYQLKYFQQKTNSTLIIYTFNDPNGSGSAEATQ